MRIAARMAVQGSTWPAATPGRASNDMIAAIRPTAMRAIGYDGHDVVVRTISSQGFVAETAIDFPPNSFVRLKVPGVGTMLAQLVRTEDGKVRGAFMTPVDPARLSRALGLGQKLAHA